MTKQEIKIWKKGTERLLQISQTLTHVKKLKNVFVHETVMKKSIFHVFKIHLHLSNTKF